MTYNYPLAMGAKLEQLSDFAAIILTFFVLNYLFNINTLC